MIQLFRTVTTCGRELPLPTTFHGLAKIRKIGAWKQGSPVRLHTLTHPSEPEFLLQIAQK